MSSSPRPRLSRPRRAAALVALFFALSCVPALRAQWIDTTLRPIGPIYGMGDDEFVIIGSVSKWPGQRGDRDGPTNDYGEIWRFSQKLGIDIIAQHYPSTVDRFLDELDASPLRRRDTSLPWGGPDRIIATISNPNGAELFYQGGFGREITFYPFDSTQSPYWHWWLDTITGGVPRQNAVQTEPWSDLHRMWERHYTDTNTTPNQMILSGLSYGDPSRFDDRTFFGNRMLELREQQNHNARTFTFLLTGHLFDQLNANPDTATVFRLEIWHRIPFGMTYFGDNFGDLRLAQNDTAMFVRSFNVTRGQLNAGWPGIPRERYRTVEFVTDLRMRHDGRPGPMHELQSWRSGPGENNDSARLVDVRVFWTGAENAAIRSIAIRDSIGQAMLGSRPQDQTYQSIAYDQIRRSMRGPAANLWRADTFRTHIIGVESGCETFYNPTEFAGFNAANKMLADSFTVAAFRARRGESAQPADSLRALMWDLGTPTFHTLGQQKDMYYYIYLNTPNDTTNQAATPEAWRVRSVYETPEHQVPTLPEHNGGRFHLPVLGLTADSVDRYTISLQRLYMGYYHPGETYPWPYEALRGHADGLGEIAAVGRAMGRRFHPHVGLVRHFEFVERPSGFVDTVASHMPEPSEILMLTNLSLAYGARGIWWWNLETDRQLMIQSPSGAWISAPPASAFGCCLGGNGFFTPEDTINLDPAFGLWRTNDDYSVNPFLAPRVTVPNYFTAWKNTTEAVTWINREWLRRIGPEMMKLRWRDAYSAHHAVEWPHDSGALFRDTLTRPFPVNEIVRKVESATYRDVLIGVDTIITDSPHKTFVEVGLFYTKPGRDPVTNARTMWRDTNAIFVINRRTFERVPDVDPNTPRGQAMDILTENRRITLHLNVPNPDPTQDAFVRVREVEPDTTTLTTGPRVPLDTVVMADSASSVVHLILGPGRGALLEITYKMPDTSLVAADLGTNGQRKILWDGRYYHSVYVRYNGTAAGSVGDSVFYRRSMQVTDTLAPVTWEPVETCLSCGTGAGDTTRVKNRTPSLTVWERGADTVVSVVWSCEPALWEAVSLGWREIVRTTFAHSSYAGGRSAIENVDYSIGHDPFKWGTPVICRLDTSEMIAWSDSTLGIVARVRTVGAIAPPARWWTAGVWSDTAQVTTLERSQTGFAGMYPTVPPFSHRATHAFDCGLAWQQRVGTTAPPNSLPLNDIKYKRLAHTTAGGLPVIGHGNSLTVAAAFLFPKGQAPNYRPSIDLVQDDTTVENRREGIVWETDYGVLSSLFFRGVEIKPSGSIHLYAQSAELAEASKAEEVGSAYPQTSSLNQSRETYFTGPGVTFSVAFRNETEIEDRMQQALIDWSAPSFRSGWPQDYAAAGRNPNAAASHHRQAVRHAVLYQIADPTTGAEIIRTTRRYFLAKERPGGYVAGGRELRVRLSESLRSGFAVRMLDPWFVDDREGRGLAMIGRTDPGAKTDTLANAAALLESEPFETGDSVTIGCAVEAYLYGDPAVAGGAEIRGVLELVDESGVAVAALDSFTVSASAPLHDVQLEPTLALASGAYTLRLRLDTVAVVDEPSAYDSRYPVTEVAAWVENKTLLAKLLRNAEEAPTGARIGARPNPFVDATELWLEIPSADVVSVTVYDGLGREVARPIERRETEAGRWGLTLDAGDLPSGTYLLVLETSTERVEEKLVIVR